MRPLSKTPHRIRPKHCCTRCRSSSRSLCSARASSAPSTASPTVSELRRPRRSTALISTRNPSNSGLWGPGYFQHDRAVARYLDSLDLPDGAVLSDVAFSYAIVLTSENPKQFVVTSDLDFDQAVADPVQFRVGYVLVPSPRSAPWEHVQSRHADLLRKR